ncbi:MAG: glycosyltransferase family 4 protein [Sedimentisphaerales bacterium]|nr:glycosyltransferase family 4 protein [Sedimentisphaerales bacterium]
MKLAIITERANITLGGAERSVFELTARMALLGVDVKILAATGTAKSRRVQVLCSNTKRRVSLNTFQKALSDHLAQNHYDIVHSTLPFEFADVYQPRGGSYPEAAIRNAASYSTAILRVFKLLTSFANARRAALAQAERKLCRIVRKDPSPKTPIVAALSQYVRLQFKKHYNLPDEKIYLCPNGIRLLNPQQAIKIDRLRAQIMSKLDIKQADEPVFFLFAAHNFRLKGLASLIKALAIVSRRTAQRPAYLIVAGRDTGRKYRVLARRLKVRDRIIFFGPAGSISNLLAVSDVAVLPTYYDPSSRFILEALGAGKPVITTKYNGATDLFTPDRHGKTFESPDDIDSLAESMRYFCNTEHIIAAKQAIEQDDIRSKVSIEAHCKRLLMLYNKINKEKLEIRNTKLETN